jgi:hypothetical protein
MGELLKAVGAVMLGMWIAGNMGLIDFSLCARPVGECAAHKAAK